MKKVFPKIFEMLQSADDSFSDEEESALTVIYLLSERGHSFLPCDRDFGCVKRSFRKHGRICIPEE
nr:unnamed protein product [Callosobruchus chinensis]